ncbi:hypothetical protein TIFTF001_012229 [Ficus carica]|uniref:Uncharacterized protein n=1 Tax=Ficus carica TaxID=3494 RepID=A0AA88DI14_FICCA|nr:hypothetical protein TIFTF001_012229 [Ficus carica]
MGGKGRKRREKNYKAAHGGGYTRLPPPPDPSQVDALPSKLRKLISFTSSLSQGSEKESKDLQKKRKNEDGVSQLSRPKDKITLESTIRDANLRMLQNTNDGDDSAKSSTSEKRKRKRKRKQIEDLRFEAPMEKSGISSKRRERKKKYLEAKKNKHKKAKTEDKLDFPGREEVKFGDIVLAPPKLATFTKALKNRQDASKERVRLQAIEEYRKRRGWTSRPGIHLPSPVTAVIES